MTYRQIHLEIWDDPWFLELDAQGKLLFIYLFSNSRTNVIGLYEVSQRAITFETGLAPEVIADGLQRFHDAGKVLFQDNWVWVTKLLTRNTDNIRSPKVQTMLKKQIMHVPDTCPFKAGWLTHYNNVVAPQFGLDTISVNVDTISAVADTFCSVTATDLYSDPVSVSDLDDAPSAIDAYVKLRGGAVNTLDVDQINDLVDECEAHRGTLPRGSPGAEYTGEQWVRAAILEANAARKGGMISLNYIKAILGRWRGEGFQAKRDGDGATSTTPEGRKVIKVQP